MVKITQNAIVYRGNRKILEYTITDEDNNDDPFDVTSYKIQWSATRIGSNGQPIQTSPVIDLNSVDNATQVVKTNPTGGVIRVILVQADTVNLQPGEYYTELEVVDGSSNSEVLAIGTITVEPNVNNA